MFSSLGACGLQRGGGLTRMARLDSFNTKGANARWRARLPIDNRFRCLLKITSHLARDRSGAAMVEFAMTGAMLLLSILWLLEVGLTYMTTLELESATKDVARVVRTHRVDDLPVPEDVKKKGKDATPNQILAGKFRKRMCDRLIFAAGCKTNLKVVVRSADDFSGLNTTQPIPDPYAADAEISIEIGGANQYVIVSTFFKSPLSVFGQERTIRAAAVTQNEP